MLSRRAALKDGTAVAASAALIGLAEAAPISDAQLIAWETEIHERLAAVDQPVEEFTEEEVDTRMDLIDELEHRIAETEAHTARGLEVKFRRLVKDIEEGKGAWTQDNIRTITATLERLARG